MANPILCVGGAVMDFLGRTQAPAVMGASNPGRMSVVIGGVARNVAENLARLRCPVALVSRVGDDDNGRRLLQQATELGIDVSGTSTSTTCPTGSFTAILSNDGEMVIALADAAICDEITSAVLEPVLPRARAASHCFLDCNLPVTSLELLLNVIGPTVCVGAVSPAKVRRLGGVLEKVGILFANLAEARSLADVDPQSGTAPADLARQLRDRGCRAGVLTAGLADVTVWTEQDLCTVPILRRPQRSVIGAGDSLVAGTMLGLTRGLTLSEAVRWGVAAASVTVESELAVSEMMSVELLTDRVRREGAA